MQTNVEKIKTAVATLFNDVLFLKQSMDEVSEWNSIPKLMANASKLYDFAQRVVLAVEMVVADIGGDLEGLKSDDKRQAAADFIDALIPLPGVLEAFDGMLIKMMIDFLVDKINARFGKSWNLDWLRNAVKIGKDWLALPFFR